MSELVLLGLKFAFLALLWLFILFAGHVIRTDLFGRRVPASALPVAEAAPPVRKLKEPRPPRESRRAAKAQPTTLRITQGAQAGLTMALGESLRIGRAADCQLILDDDYVSTRHARLYASPKGLMVEDLGSTNGTYVNNERVTSPVAFGRKDTLRIGRTHMVVEG